MFKSPVGYLINTAAGLQGERGIAYDYILGNNGLFLQAKNTHLAATVCIAPAMVRGLAPLEESIKLLHGAIPMHFLELALSVLCVKPDIEQYITVTWEDGYNLRIPPQEQTAASVNYEVVDGTVLDIHSHVGGVPADFSGKDDRDEQGFCLSAVVGDLRNLCPTIELRLAIYGYFLTLDKEDIFV